MRCPAHTISQSDFHPVIRPFSPLRLGRSYKLAPEPDGSPLFTSTPLVACWRYEPREHLRPLAKSRSLIPPSPLRDRVGYSDHVRFRGYFPVHFIPAYNLPAYASQRPLPDATQDLVRGCSLGFATAVIADGRLQRACKAQLPHHRTYGSVYGGSRSYANALRSNDSTRVGWAFGFIRRRERFDVFPPRLPGFTRRRR